MSQIFWMLSLLPDNVLNVSINIAIILGLILTFALSFINSIYIDLYKPPLQLLGILLLIVGIFFKGYIISEMEWKAKITEEQEKVRISEEKSKKAVEDLANEIERKKSGVKEVQVVIKERIKTVEKQIDKDCNVDFEAISIINDAALNRLGYINQIEVKK